MKVLVVLPSIFSYGGIERFAYSLWIGLRKLGHEVDFVCHGSDIGVYESEIICLGGNIFHIPVKSKHPFLYKKRFEKIIKEGKYDVIHCNMNCTSGIYLKIAQKYGVRVRVAHAHASRMSAITKNPIKMLINAYEKFNTRKYANVRIACSNDAGKWLFKDNFTVVYNSIKKDLFKYNLETRIKLRRNFNLVDKQVIIHVGSFLPVKNHRFLIDAFLLAKQHDSNIKLVLVGDGPLKKNIISYIEKLNLINDVIILGSRNDVNELLQMADIFVLPSLSEGNPISLTEAAYSGLHCLISNKVPSGVEELFLPNQIERLNIDDFNGKNCWAEKMINKHERIDYSLNDNIDLDVMDMAKNIENLYTVNMGR